MQFIQGTNRHQSYFAILEEQVSADSPARLIDVKHNLIVHTQATNTNDAKALHQAAVQAKANLQLQKEDTLMVLADKG